MNLKTVFLNEEQAKSLIDDVELSPDEKLKNLVFKILQKAGKPLHCHDIEYVVVNKGYYQANSKEIPINPFKSLVPVLRPEHGICKISDRVYGLTEWQTVAEDTSKEEIDITAQAPQQDASPIDENLCKVGDLEKLLPECNQEIESEFHFCPHCRVDAPDCSIDLKMNLNNGKHMDFQQIHISFNLVGSQGTGLVECRLDIRDNSC